MRGKISVTRGLVLSSREYRETDRIAVMYTEDVGKIRVRYIGVNRPKGKLKALSEPMVLGEYRLYLREDAEFATVAGGQLDTAFPRIRSGLADTLNGLEIVELLDRLTAFWKPNPQKLELAVDCLRLVEKYSGDAEKGSWIVPAFALRLLDEAGFGQQGRKVSQENRFLWDVLHRAELTQVADIPPDPALRARLERFLKQTVERVSEQPLNTSAMRDKLIGVTV